MLQSVKKSSTVKMKLWEKKYNASQTILKGVSAVRQTDIGGGASWDAISEHETHIIYGPKSSSECMDIL